MSDLLALALYHATNEGLHGWLHLIFTPEFKDSFIALLLSVITHTQRGFMWIMRVERISQEIKPFHHHKLHRLVELSRINSLVVLHALASGFGS